MGRRGLNVHLGADGSSVAVKLGVSFDVVGIDGQGLRVELISLLEIALFKSLVPFFFLSLQSFGILQWEKKTTTPL